RIMHLAAIAAIICLVSRVGGVVESLSGTAQAAQEAARTEPAAGGEEGSASHDAHSEEPGEEAAEAIPVPVPAPPMMDGKTVQWKDPGDIDFEYSTVDENLYKAPLARGEAVEKREKELAVRQALLKAAEPELGQKIGEMNSLKSQ